jgi:hypothetical protein
MLKRLIHICLLIIFLSTSHCGTTTTGNLLGGTEIGNPPISTPRALVGDITHGANINVNRDLDGFKYALSTTCPADLVKATNAANATFSAVIDDACSFELTVESGYVYSLFFYFEDEMIATLEVDNNSDFLLSPYFLVSADDNAMDLGSITITGESAFPEFQPATLNDADGDGLVDYDDNDDDDDGIADSLEADCDADGFPDDYDTDNTSCSSLTDTDSDGVADDQDNCIDDANADQSDVDADGDGDACDTDDDDDNVLDSDDNCILVVNPNQDDVDADGIGDVCDDSDGDLVMDDADNCVSVANADQTDTDSDGVGDACDPDDDNDGILDDGDGSGTIGDNTCLAGNTTNCDDNCLVVANQYQVDMNYNGIGDACDPTPYP